MKVSKAIQQLSQILEENGDLPIYCVWVETDEYCEEYTIKEEPTFHKSIINDEIHISY